MRRLLDRADGVSRKALREAVFYVVGPYCNPSDVLRHCSHKCSCVLSCQPSNSYYDMTITL